MSANDKQVGGNHYKTDGRGEEHWDRVARMGMDYWQAAITKYVERCWKKNGLEDLEKAKHYLEKYIELAEEQKVGPQAALDDTTFTPTTFGKSSQCRHEWLRSDGSLICAHCSARLPPQHEDTQPPAAVELEMRLGWFKARCGAAVLIYDTPKANNGLWFGIAHDPDMVSLQGTWTSKGRGIPADGSMDLVSYLGGGRPAL